MILKQDVQNVVETFIRSAMKDHAQTADALLSNPKLPGWYSAMAAELCKQEAEAVVMRHPFDPGLAIKKWAVGYVEHVLDHPNIRDRAYKDVKASLKD